MLASEVTVVREFVGASERLGALDARDDRSFTARSGQRTGSLGPSGAGETSAVRAVFGLVELDAGSRRWRGRTDRADGAGSVRLHAGGTRPAVPQMRVRDQVVYFGRLTLADAHNDITFAPMLLYAATALLRPDDVVWRVWALPMGGGR